MQGGDAASNQRISLSSTWHLLNAGLVHVDYTTKGGPNRLQHVLPEEAEKLSRTPYAIVQVCNLSLRALTTPSPPICSTYQRSCQTYDLIIMFDTSTACSHTGLHPMIIFALGYQMKGNLNSTTGMETTEGSSRVLAAGLD